MPLNTLSHLRHCTSSTPLPSATHLWTLQPSSCWPLVCTYHCSCCHLWCLDSPHTGNCCHHMMIRGMKNSALVSSKGIQTWHSVFFLLTGSSLLPQLDPLPLSQLRSSKVQALETWTRSKTFHHLQRYKVLIKYNINWRFCLNKLGQFVT